MYQVVTSGYPTAILCCMLTGSLRLTQNRWKWLVDGVSCSVAPNLLHELLKWSDRLARAVNPRYVNRRMLNPVRAVIASTPACSAHTRIQLRIDHWKSKASIKTNSVIASETYRPESLMPFTVNPRRPMPRGIPFSVLGYTGQVDWTGRQIREDKRRAIEESQPSILNWLSIAAE